jgi:hypothetical protein
MAYHKRLRFPHVAKKFGRLTIWPPVAFLFDHPRFLEVQVPLPIGDKCVGIAQQLKQLISTVWHIWNLTQLAKGSSRLLCAAPRFRATRATAASAAPLGEKGDPGVLSNP